MGASVFYSHKIIFAKLSVDIIPERISAKDCGNFVHVHKYPIVLCVLVDVNGISYVLKSSFNCRLDKFVFLCYTINISITQEYVRWACPIARRNVLGDVFYLFLTDMIFRSILVKKRLSPSA